jgi:hypothetical protein
MRFELPVETWPRVNLGLTSRLLFVLRYFGFASSAYKGKYWNDVSKHKTFQIHPLSFQMIE